METPHFRTPHNSETPQPISIKFGTDDDIDDTTLYAKLLYVQRGRFPVYVKLLPPVSIVLPIFFTF